MWIRVQEIKSLCRGQKFIKWIFHRLYFYSRATGSTSNSYYSISNPEYECLSWEDHHRDYSDDDDDDWDEDDDDSDDDSDGDVNDEEEDGE